MNTIAGSSDLLSYYNDLYSTSGKTSGSNLENTLTNKDYSTATEEELMDVCKQFESHFVEQMLKQMEKMVPKSEESSTTDKYMDYFGDTFNQYITQTITESNGGQGIGIAKTLYEQMKINYGLE